MPPSRMHVSGAGISKPIRTERTHEENQERAYIAASRRSDRSLEARIESARRASEIHKKRTGRALRVTEQDVINEEMYEEEDEDYPAQYRRLTAHLNTGSAEFNRKFHAYMQSQAGTRMALSALNPQFPTQQFVNPQAFNGAYMNPQHFNTYPMQQPMMQPQMVAQPASYRQSPYPMAQNPQLATQMQQQHQRSASFATPQDVSSFQTQSALTNATGFDERRMSLPVKGQRPTLSRSPSSVHTLGSIKKESAGTPGSTSRKSASPSQGTSPTVTTPQGVFYSMPSTPLDGESPAQQQNFGNILTTSMPAESQIMLNGVLDPNDPLMSGSNWFTQPGAFLGGDAFSGFPSKPFTSSQTMAPTLQSSGANDDYNSLSFSDNTQLFSEQLFGDAKAPMLTPNSNGDLFDDNNFGSFINEDYHNTSTDNYS